MLSTMHTVIASLAATHKLLVVYKRVKGGGVITCIDGRWRLVLVHRLVKLGLN